MSLKTVVSPATAPDSGRMRETANLQLGSTLFGKLPLELRDMIYSECWKASGLKQHVFIRHGSLTHWPCILASHEADARLEELQRMVQVQEVPPGSRTRTLILDDKWAARFSSPWHEHWRCEEEMKEKVFDDDGTFKGHPSRPRRTLFLPILMACKRTYLEARHSLYASLTLVFTDATAAHACLALSPSTVSAQLHSLDFSLVLPSDTLHQHRLRPSPAEPAGPWADLCTRLSDLVRFAALRDVTIRLGLPSTSACNAHGVDRRKTGCVHEIYPRDLDVNTWLQVRERWAMSAIRGMLARHLVVQLPRTEPTQRRPTWVRPYSYPENEDETEGESVPFRRLERYAALPPMRFRSDGRVEPRMDAPRRSTAPLFSITLGDASEGDLGHPRYAGVRGRAKGRNRLKATGFLKARRGVRKLMAGLKPN
ncbi:hypothetical protein F5Y13DRAFT_160350 [Hypoxylon sp. FL1857]|nr:hypothetical protein F5Y13DRAFT_160350 [Hypoxylon sp. FL1857]